LVATHRLGQVAPTGDAARPHRHEPGLDALERRRIAPGLERSVAALHGDRAARHRHVEHGGAARRHRRADLARHRRADGGHLDEEGAGAEAGHDPVGAEGDGAQRRVVGDHAERGLGRLGDGARRGGRAQAGAREIARLVRRAVPADDRVPRGQEARRQAAAHRAEADPAEGRHQSPPVTAIAVISSLQRGCVARRDTSTVVVVGRWSPR
jgi:hypothetical protein